MMINSELMAELRRRAEAATSGPWWVFSGGEIRSRREGVRVGVLDHERDYDFVDLAHPLTVIELLDEIDRLRSELEAVSLEVKE